jgi:hypothetical protein
MTACFLAGRLFARIQLDIGLGADDWTMIAAFTTYLIDVSTSLGLVLNGFGEHTYWLDKDNIIAAMKVFKN